VFQIEQFSSSRTFIMLAGFDTEVALRSEEVQLVLDLDVNCRRAVLWTKSE
jgi:hypothetical protein